MERTDRTLRRQVGPTFEALEVRDMPSIGWPGPGSPSGVRDPRPTRGLISRAEIQERARDRFFAAFAGSYVIGRGGPVDASRRTFMRGGGNSSAFLHGDILLSIDTPSDPSMVPTGKAALYVKNYAETGNLLSLELVGDPQGARDGRPTRFSWTVGDDSSGAFAGSEGEGSLEIRYKPGGKLPPHAIDAGHAGVKLLGRLHVNRVANPIGL